MKKILTLLFCDIAIIMLSSCSSGSEEVLKKGKTSPSLKSLEFLYNDNSEVLISSICGTIVGDSTVHFWIPYLMPNKLLVPHITYNGGVIDNKIISEKERYVFSKPVVISVFSGDSIQRYKVYVHSFTGLPVMWIDTDYREPVVSKEKYVYAHMRLVEDVVTRGPDNQIDADLEIKGRGNTTWGYEKKTYCFKF